MITRTTLVVAVGMALLACARSQAESHEKQAPQAVKSSAAHTAKSSSAQAPSSAEIGKPAPDFALTDTEGKTHRLSEQRGKTVVLEWFNPDCPFVKYARGKGPLASLPQKYMSDSIAWLSINSGAPGKQGHGEERNRKAKSDFGISNPILLDESGTVGRAYGAQKTPHMFIIDPQGTLVYRGGLDNAPMGRVDDERPRPQSIESGELVPYVENALADLRAGRPIALSDTPAYGCSVKYAD